MAGIPGRSDLTLAWKPETDQPETDLTVAMASHTLVGRGVKVRVIPAGKSWRAREGKEAPKQG
ncbi:hypothetical protein [Bradyrhizobium yuanmingense]|uniref:hypothetical protein n=1 Tax=Bradyrhizobium yuanmingense TaxID=108015 RepID=UPI0023B8AA4F|nr:hypothetical protein [Bradyrhizobium yuanmingense]MDF0584949.1 hypothetical protein [Bradyrhizobium yuanmingense]